MNNIDSLSGGDHRVLHNPRISIELRELLDRLGRSVGDELLPLLGELGRVLGGTSKESEDGVVGFELSRRMRKRVSEGFARRESREEEEGRTEVG